MPFFSVTSVSPVCVSVFGLDVYWYGVAYVVSLWLALFYAKRVAGGVLRSTEIGAFQQITSSQVKRYVDSFLPLACIGIIIGGRLGHVLFFDMSYYFHDLRKILFIRDGGMSFHGGLLGIIAVAAWFCRKEQIQLISYFDLISMVAPIGLGIGRLANFVNSELYGVPTNLPWGVLFHGTLEPRHPTQIYEALTEGVLTLSILALFYCCRKRRQPGDISVLFLLCYGTSRFLIDFLKDSRHYCGLTMGQWLSLIMVFGGILLSYFLRKSAKSA
ncbi:MAG: prolipoprotein diacylglyceryl transferase [Holosporales bacterium]|jgi:phosphatidylglycerol:prolipoprotein diacylglycerol transferase|nr:prolipoprotein diacylglyceryl transferase [Holosporales bacterium]